MKVDPNAALLSKAAESSSARLSVDAQSGWADQFTVGQIIKGRVLRQYSDGKYEVSLAGEPRVVDSTIQLAVGSEFSGKVSGLADQVTIERVSVTGDADKAPAVGTRAVGTRHDDPAAVIATELRVPLKHTEAKAISGIGAKSADSELVIRLGILAAKLGVPVDRNAMRLIQQFVDHGMPVRRSSIESVVEMAVVPNASPPLQESSDHAAALQALARWMADSAVSDRGEPGDAAQQADDTDAEGGGSAMSSNDQATTGGDESDAGAEGFRRWVSALLNAQDGSVVSHRYQTLPVMIDGQMREFDLALFEHGIEHRSAEAATTVTRRICFSLDTDCGRVSIDARVANERVSLNVATERPDFCRALAAEVGGLGTRLADAGWQLCEADYQVSSCVRPAAVVADHMLAHDSLLRVM